MTKMLCDFRFDGATYCIAAHLDRNCEVRDLSAIPAQKGARARDVGDTAELLGALLRNGLPFAALAQMNLSPIGKAMAASVERAGAQARRSLGSFSASAKGEEA